MKIIKRTFIVISALYVVTLSSCAIFNGGEKCDCPKFGENNGENNNSDEASAEKVEINAYCF